MAIYVAGRLNIDYIMTLRTPLIRGEKALADTLIIDYGGSGGNVATAIARFLKKSKAVRFVGCVGDDERGKAYIELLQREGIDTTFINIIQGIPTGRAIVLVEEGGVTTVISYRGANEVCKTTLNRLDDIEMLVMTNPPLNIAYGLMEQALERMSSIVIDPSRGWSSLSQLGILSEAHSCVLVPNESELLWLTGTHILEHAIFTALRILPSCMLVIKRGSLGALLVDPNRSVLVEIPALPLKELGLEILSTAGCGDTFTGVLSAAIYERRDIIEAMQLATVAAGIKASRLYTRGIPHREEILELFERVKPRLSIREKRL